MKTIVFDLESDALLNEATVIWCATLHYLEEDRTVSLRPHEIDQLSQLLSEGDLIICHNITNFDIPLMKKILKYEHKGKYFDTLLGSRVLWPDLKRESYVDRTIICKKCDGYRTLFTQIDFGFDERICEGCDGKGYKEVIKKAKTPHGLENWGLIFGVEKPVHEDWSQFSEEMLIRNQKDVEINVLLYKKIQKHIKDLQINDKRLNNWEKIWAMEHYFARGMFKQEQNGWYFNINLASDVEKELDEIVKNIDNELDPYLPIRVVKPYKEGICKGLKQNGEATSHAISWVGIENEDRIAGDFCRVEFKKTDLNSPDQLKEFLFLHGWVPKNYNYKKDEHNKPLKDENRKIIYTSPQTPKTAEEWDELAQQMDNPTIKLLAERGKASHRLSTVRGYFKRLRPDKRISCVMNTCGTPTFRARHSGIVNVPKAKDHVYYGHQFRRMFSCPDGKILVGCDAKAIEARMEAHYVYQFDKKASELILAEDIHDINAAAWDVNRDIAKNGKYCLTYGGGKWKLAETLQKPNNMSEELYEAFWRANPGLKALNVALERQWQKMGYLISIDGRPITIRYGHAVLNSVLQSAGAIVMKIAWCFADKRIQKEGLNTIDVGNYHDEIDQETIPELSEYVGKILEESIVKAGEYLKLNIPLAGESKYGKNWQEIH